MSNLELSERVLVRVSGEPRLASERRDTERAITLWHEKASELGTPPPAEAFDFSHVTDWGYRFIICGADITNSVFLIYGSHFARLLGLPANPIYCEPMIVQLPTRYRPLFTEGCEAAFSTAAVTKFNGAFVHNSSAELYRAAFMPLRLKVDALKPIVFGSFNYRTLDRIPDEWRQPST